MGRPGDAVDIARRHRANVVGVDLEADAALPGVIDAEGCGPGGERLGQHHRGAAVQDPGGLAGALVDRHAPLHIVVAGLDQLDADMADQRALVSLVREVEWRLSLPDRHGRAPSVVSGLGRRRGSAGSSPAT